MIRITKIGNILIIIGALNMVISLVMIRKVSGAFILLFLALAAIIVGVIINKKVKSTSKPNNMQTEAFNKTQNDINKPLNTQENTNNIGDAYLKQQASFNALANEKNISYPISKQELINVFNTYFAPNKDFYTVPGSDNFNAYFGVVNAARDEMINNQQLFMQATKWSTQELAELLNSNIPGVTNMLVCGLIFKLGEFAVIKDAVYCVDFSEAIPNCVALYLLLIAQKLPSDKRTMVIDAGDGTNKAPLTNAINSLKILDNNWNCNIW